jgi:soluble lytic murein transglycosylase-like protein
LLLAICGFALVNLANGLDEKKAEVAALEQEVSDLKNQPPPAPVVVVLEADDIVCDSIGAPSELMHIFNEMGGKYNIYPSLLAAIAKQESQFDIQAVSPAGAQGLMGLMPITVRHLKERHGLDIDPFDPRQAVEGAAVYLRELQERFVGEEVLAAYNLGPTRLRALRGDFSGIQETTDYVKIISRTSRREMPGAVLSE